MLYWTSADRTNDLAGGVDAHLGDLVTSRENQTMKKKLRGRGPAIWESVDVASWIVMLKRWAGLLAVSQAGILLINNFPALIKWKLVHYCQDLDTSILSEILFYTNTRPQIAFSLRKWTMYWFIFMSLQSNNYTWGSLCHLESTTGLVIKPTWK